MKFPKNLYLVVDADDASDNDNDFDCLSRDQIGTSSIQQEVIEDANDGDFVAVYQLVKQGKVATSRKVVFE